MDLSKYEALEPSQRLAIDWKADENLRKLAAGGGADGAGSLAGMIAFMTEGKDLERAMLTKDQATIDATVAEYLEHLRNPPKEAKSMPPLGW